jgi:hypothetical protein
MLVPLIVIERGPQLFYYPGVWSYLNVTREHTYDVKV